MGKQISFVKCTDSNLNIILTMYIQFSEKNSAAFSNLVQVTLYSLDVNIVLLLGDVF